MQHADILGTVTNIDEAVQWLNYTYLIVRMHKNLIAYGMSYNELEVSQLSQDMELFIVCTYLYSLILIYQSSITG